MTGFNKVMRFCDTLQDYESAKSQGLIDDDLFVVILEDKICKFKGKTFDWGEADLSSLVTKEEFTEAELSADSENPLQNKAVANALSDKVDKERGKQLTTEDFTSALKAKLESLNNYDDAEIVSHIATIQETIDTLFSKDASSAIESFNEIISFLEGVEDSESLDNIIASIETQLSEKANVNDVPTVMSVLNAVYPVGAIYVSTVSTDPSTLFGFGTWERIKDTFLLAAGDVHSGGESGGEETHLLTKDEMPSHTHKFERSLDDGAQGPKGDQGEQGPKGDKGDKGDTGATGANGTNGKDGADGATFTPSVDANGNLSWTNNKGLSNPPTVNIKGPKGDSGEGGGGASGVKKEVISLYGSDPLVMKPDVVYG